MRVLNRSIFLSLIFAIQIPLGLVYASESCCGPITEKGAQLASKLDTSGVDRLWIAGKHINWKTGEPDNGKQAHTHCSAFVASFVERQGFYILRPPQHSQILLASAQVAWLASEDAKKDGWYKVGDMKEAQSISNKGVLTVAAFPSPNPKKPGHIAIVRPAEISLSKLEENGPQITQAGQHNFLSTTLREGFKQHKGAWPNGMVYYAHQ